MDRLEQLVRDTLAEHADAAPNTLAEHADAAPTALPARPSQRRRPHRTWWAAAAASAAVIAIVAGLSVAQSSVDSAPPAGPGAQQTAPLAPAGYELVSYHGIQFAVPPTMEVTDLKCGFLLPNQVLALDPGAPPTGCTPLPGPKPIAGATYVQATPDSGPSRGPGSRFATTRTVLAGQSARIGYGTLHDYPGVTGVLVMPDPGVQLTVTAPNRTQVTTILRSVRLVSVDAADCPRHEPALADNGAASSLAPTGAIAIAMCGYGNFAVDHGSDFWIIRATEVPQRAIEPWLSQLDALPPASPASTRASHVYVRLGYPGGKDRWLALSSSADEGTTQLFLSDGHTTRLIPPNSHLGNLLYSGIEWPKGAAPQLPTLGSAPPSPRGSGQHTSSPSSTPTSTAAVMPAGYKVVSYDGIEIAVPHSLPVTHSPCEPPVNAVYAANGAAYSCPAQTGSAVSPPPGAVMVWLGAARGSSVHLTPKSHTASRTVAGVPVTVLAPTRAQVETIVNSIRTATVGPLGCPAHPTSITPSGQPVTAHLVPPTPDAAVVCEFAAIGTNHAYSLVGSRRLAAAKLTALVTALDALAARPAANTGLDLPLEDWIVFTYPDGHTRTVGVQMNASPGLVTDGNRTVSDVHARVFGLLTR